MEIKRYLDLYNQNSPKDFFDWLAKGATLEIRFLSDRHGQKFNAWELIKTLSTELGVESRFSSLFISDYDTLKKILLYRLNGVVLTRLYNIFISVNPKRKVNILTNNGLLMKSYYGGIAGTSHIQTILCDIEHTGDRGGNATEAMIEECIQGAEYLVKLLELSDYYINISGNGVHLWIAMNPAIELPLPNYREVVIKGKPTIKYNLKEEPINSWVKTYNAFIEKLNKQLKAYNPKLKVDEGAKDISRIARAAGSWNVKTGKVARAVGTVSKNNKLNILINSKFLAVKPILNKDGKKFKKIKIQSKNHRYNALNVKECPLYKLLISELLPSTLSRNHYLEQSFSRILRDNDITIDEVDDLVAQMDLVQQKTVQVDPDYLDDEEIFNSETINNYCYTCKVDLVYPILEETYDITDGYISNSHYQNLNNYSDATVEMMAVDIALEKPKSYFNLKTLIRQLIDKHERSSVFFTLKKLLKDDWEYLHKNRVIQQLMNKTRVQK